LFQVPVDVHADAVLIDTRGFEAEQVSRLGDVGEGLLNVAGLPRRRSDFGLAAERLLDQRDQVERVRPYRNGRG
jgi:hypothetical protein